MLTIKNLAVAYGKHQALHGLDLYVDDGEVVVMLGANGAGKSTLLKAIARLVSALDGSEIKLDEHDLRTMQAFQVVEAGVALVPEGRGVFGSLTVRENLQLGAHARRARKNEAENLDRVLSLFPRLGERLGQIVSTMSGGEQQMVAIGRALMSAPDILLLDEPSLGLSPIMTSDLFKALEGVRTIGISVLLVEQNAKKSLALADRAYLLENGRIVGSGTAKELANNAAVQQAYLGLAAAE